MEIKNCNDIVNLRQLQLEVDRNLKNLRCGNIVPSEKKILIGFSIELASIKLEENGEYGKATIKLVSGEDKSNLVNPWDILLLELRLDAKIPENSKSNIELYKFNRNNVERLKELSKDYGTDLMECGSEPWKFTVSELNNASKVYSIQDIEKYTKKDRSITDDITKISHLDYMAIVLNKLGIGELGYIGINSDSMDLNEARIIEQSLSPRLIIELDRVSGAKLLSDNDELADKVVDILIKQAYAICCLISYGKYAPYIKYTYKYSSDIIALNMIKLVEKNTDFSDTSYTGNTDKIVMEAITVNPYTGDTEILKKEVNLHAPLGNKRDIIIEDTANLRMIRSSTERFERFISLDRDIERNIEYEDIMERVHEIARQENSNKEQLKVRTGIWNIPEDELDDILSNNMMFRDIRYRINTVIGDKGLQYIRDIDKKLNTIDMIAYRIKDRTFMLVNDIKYRISMIGVTENFDSLIVPKGMDLSSSFKAKYI